MLREKRREGGQFVLTDSNDSDITACCLLANLNLSDVGWAQIFCSKCAQVMMTKPSLYSCVPSCVLVTRLITVFWVTDRQLQLGLLGCVRKCAGHYWSGLCEGDSVSRNLKFAQWLTRYDDPVHPPSCCNTWLWTIYINIETFNEARR